MCILSPTCYGCSRIKLAQFDRSPAPDVVFTYDGCTECEGDHFLGAFEFNADSRGWTARQWDKERSLLLAYDPSPGDNVLSSDYLFKIKDWNGDGFDDVAVRRRTVTQIGKGRKETEDATAIYSAEGGKLVGHGVTDSKEREGINADLCSDSDLTFCQRHE